MLKKVNRITKNNDFKRILKKGRFINTTYFLLKYTKNNLSVNRFGFVVSKKIAKKATVRNLLKRRMRELLRKLNIDIKNGYDIIFVMRKNSPNLTFSDLKKNILTALEKAGLKK